MSEYDEATKAAYEVLRHQLSQDQCGQATTPVNTGSGLRPVSANSSTIASEAYNLLYARRSKLMSELTQIDWAINRLDDPKLQEAMRFQDVLRKCKAE